MKIYSFSVHGIAQARRRFAVRMALFVVMAFVIVSVVMAVQGGYTWLTLFISVPLMLGICVYSIGHGLKEQEEILRSVRIEVGDDYVARSQLRVPQVRIARAEVTAIEEAGIGLCIRTTDQRRSLAIPAELDSSDYQQIKAVLSTWATIRSRSRGTAASNALGSVVMLAGMGVFFLAQEVWLVLTAGLVVVVYYAYTLWILRSSEGVDPKVERWMLFGAVFMALLIIFRVTSLLLWPV
jgi:hypothetical protein